MENLDEGIFTSLIRCRGVGKSKVIPVKSTKPINKSLWLTCSIALSKLYLGLPVKVGTVVCSNILNLGVDIVCTKNIEK